MRKKIVRHQDNHSVNFSFPPPFWSEDKNKANQSNNKSKQTNKQKENHQTPKIVETRKEKKIKRKPGNHRRFKNVFNRLFPLPIESKLPQL